MMLYECGVRYGKTAPNGMIKKVTELYLVDAISFAQAEARVTGEILPYASADIDVVTIKRTNYSEIVESDAASADKWFKAKLMYITLDEKSAKEKKTGGLPHRPCHRHQRCPPLCGRAHERLCRGLRDCHAQRNEDH